VLSFQEKPTPAEARSTLASTGIYIFEPEVLDFVPSDTVFDIGSHLFPLLVERGLLFYAQNRFFNWIDIGRVSDHWSARQRVLRGEVAQMDMPGREVQPGVWVGHAHRAGAELPRDDRRPAVPRRPQRRHPLHRRRELPTALG